MPHNCRQCGSERIVPAVRLAPTAGAGTLLGQLRARVCADCGYTELFTDAAMTLYLAHQREVAGPPRPAQAAPAANLQCPRCGSVVSAASASCDVCGWSSPGTPA